MSLPNSFLVSGGSGGIGAAVCEQFAARGIRPIVGYGSNREAAQAVAERTAGIALHLDLTDDDSIQRAVATLETDESVLAGVVLAGSPPPELAPFGKITAAQMQLQWQVNVMGPQKLLAELVRRCLRKHKRGAIVGVLTKAMGEGDLPASAGMGAYVIGKFGMAGMLALLAADYPWLRVSSVKPGYTETKMLQAFDERFLEMQKEHGAFQTADEVAAQIVIAALGEQ